MTGQPRWIDNPSDQGGLAWSEVLSHWCAIESDFQERYGIDLSSKVLLRRTGRWLRTRILGLLDVESRLRLILFPPDERR